MQRLPAEREQEARQALARAKDVGEEYEDVAVSAEVVPRPQRRCRDRRGGAAARGRSDRRRG